MLVGQRRTGCSLVAAAMLHRLVEVEEVVESPIGSVVVEYRIEVGQRRMLLMDDGLVVPAAVVAEVDRRSRLLVALAGWRIGKCLVRSRTEIVA